MACRYSSAMTHANGERQGGSRITKEKAGLKSYSQEFSRVKNCRTLFLFLPHGVVGLHGLCLDDHRGITSLRVLRLIGDDPRHIAGGQSQTSRHSRATLAPLSRHSCPPDFPLKREEEIACRSLKKLFLKSGAKIMSK